MEAKKSIKIVIHRRLRGLFLIDGNCAEVRLNPIESTLFRLFLAHPEGIGSENLLVYWKELVALYGHESVYDERLRQEEAMESLCSESKTVFYSNISRIKRKFVEALGSRKAAGYYIKRYADGLYRTKATLKQTE